MVEREQLPMDVVFVGAGPANLASALHLKKLITEHDLAISTGKKQGRKIGEIEIAIVEKGSTVGAHILSGAVMDPRAIKELMPDFIEQGCPVDAQVTTDAAWYLTTKSIASRSSRLANDKRQHDHGRNHGDGDDGGLAQIAQHLAVFITPIDLARTAGGLCSRRCDSSGIAHCGNGVVKGFLGKIGIAVFMNSF